MCAKDIGDEKALLTTPQQMVLRHDSIEVTSKHPEAMQENTRAGIGAP